MATVGRGIAPTHVRITLSVCIAARAHLGDGAIPLATAAREEIVPEYSPHAVFGAQAIVLDAGAIVRFVALAGVEARKEEGPEDIFVAHPHGRGDGLFRGPLRPQGFGEHWRAHDIAISHVVPSQGVTQSRFHVLA
jgi:hypothetical protein